MDAFHVFAVFLTLICSGASAENSSQTDLEIELILRGGPFCSVESPNFYLDVEPYDPYSVMNYSYGSHNGTDCKAQWDQYLKEQGYSGGLEDFCEVIEAQASVCLE